MQVGSKNISILIYCPILNYGFISLPDLHDLPETAVQKIYLQVKRPALHVLIETMEIGIGLNIFIMRFPSEMLCKQTGEGSLPGTDVPSTKGVL